MRTIQQYEQREKDINKAQVECLIRLFRALCCSMERLVEKVKREYSRKRRTVIENAEEAVFEERKIEEHKVLLLMDCLGYTRTVDDAVYERNKEVADAESKHIMYWKMSICLRKEQKARFYIKKKRSHSIV